MAFGSTPDNAPTAVAIAAPETTVITAVPIARSASVPDALSNIRGEAMLPVPLPTAAEFLTPKVVTAAADAPTWPGSKVRFSEQLVSSTSTLTLTDADAPSSSRMSVADSQADEGFFRSKCFCGAVTLSVDLKYGVVSASACHCSQCRRISGAPFSSNIVLPKQAIEILVNVESTRQVLLDQRTSRGVVRRRCAKCFSPLLATLGRERVVIPAALFCRPHPPSWAMHHHIWYSQRVIDVPDSLPKYAANFGGQRCTDAGELVPMEGTPGETNSNKTGSEVGGGGGASASAAGGAAETADGAEGQASPSGHGFASD